MGRQSLLSLVFIVLLVVGGCATGQLNGKPRRRGGNARSGTDRQERAAPADHSYA